MDEGSTAATKTCPCCAETFQAAAIKCRYCGSSLVASMPSSESASPPAESSGANPVAAISPTEQPASLESAEATSSETAPSNQEGRPASSAIEASPPAIGGFLVLLTLGLVLFPIRFAATAWDAYGSIFKIASVGYSSWFLLWQFQRQNAYLVLLGLVLDLGTFSIWILLIQAYFRRLESTRRLLFAFMFVSVVGSGIALSMAPASGPSKGAAGDASIVWSLIWMIYVATGKRPKRTFVAMAPLRRRWLAGLPILGAVVFAWAAHAAMVDSRAPRAQMSEVELKTNDILLRALLNEPKVAARAADLEKHPRTKGADPWGELAGKGLLRLNDDSLARWVILISRMLESADEETCAAKWTGNQNKLGSLVSHLSGVEVDQWAEISASAALAELLEEPPTIAPKPDDGTAVLTAVIARLVPDDAAKFAAVLQHTGPLSDERACWAVRILFSRFRGLDPETKKVAGRWLAAL